MKIIKEKWYGIKDKNAQSQWSVLEVTAQFQVISCQPWSPVSSLVIPCASVVACLISCVFFNPYAVAGLFCQYEMMQKCWKIIETLARGYSSEISQWELSNEYQHDRVKMVFKNLCILVLWMKVASALEGFTLPMLSSVQNNCLPRYKL